MSESIPTAGIASEPGVSTLGSVLCAARAKHHTPESTWVALVRAIATGDQLALRDLYGRMNAVVFTLIVRIVRDTETAEELTLDVFHDVWRRAESYDEAGGTVVGWIMNQARSRAIDQTRFERRKKRVNPYPESTELVQEGNSGAEMDSRARDDLLRAAVAKLTPHERSAIEMAYFSECTYAEAAARLGEPPGTVKTRIRSGLGKLRLVLGSDADS